VDLFRYQECDLNIGQATKFIAEMRSKRRALFKAGRVLDDAVAWTIVAESVIQASLRRTESRGCFYRSDHPMSVERMQRHFSCTSYDAEADVVTSRLIRIADLQSALLSSRDETDYRIAVS
jgi:aspartate oxidase